MPITTPFSPTLGDISNTDLPPFPRSPAITLRQCKMIGDMMPPARVAVKGKWAVRPDSLMIGS
jgi:hypothetical protein